MFAGAGHQRDERIVDDGDTRLETNPSHDALNRLSVVRTIYAGNPQANRVRSHVAMRERVLHHLMQDLLDGELA